MDLGSSFDSLMNSYNIPDMVQDVLRIFKFILGVALIFK